MCFSLKSQRRVYQNCIISSFFAFVPSSTHVGVLVATERITEDLKCRSTEELKARPPRSVDS
jgi:hypothetical protein